MGPFSILLLNSFPWDSFESVIGKSLSHLVNYAQQFTFINNKQIGSEADLSCDYQHCEAKADLIVHLYDLYFNIYCFGEPFIYLQWHIFVNY